MRIGSDKIINVDVRIITATNANLEKRILEGTFRSDLFYRLNVIPLSIAPLRKRKEDILPLLQGFLGKMYGSISSKDKDIFLNYSWPGNIRELENAAAYYRILGAVPDYIDCVCNRMPVENSALQCSGGTKHFPDQGESNILQTVLNIIADSSQSFCGIGRSALIRKLEDENVSIGEGKLRGILTQLQNEGLIKVNMGRSGSQITPKGRESLTAPASFK